jgi:hypothetical protein
VLGHIKASRFLLTILLTLSAGCSTETATAMGYTKIDDMEGRAARIEWMPGSGMIPGYWWSATDCSEADNISPLPWFVDEPAWSYAVLPAPHETFPGIVSRHATRLRTTSPLVGIWGANTGFDFAEISGLDAAVDSPSALDAPLPLEVDAAVLDGSSSATDADASIADAGPTTSGPACPSGATFDLAGRAVDLSAYSGVTFWAMADPRGTKNIRVQLNDRDTDPRGGICSPNESSANACYNGFSANVPLTGTFERYTIDFSSLQQNPAWGYQPDPSVLDLHHVYSMNFELDLPGCTTTATFMCAGGTPSVSFDFWIDDLYLVNK